MANREGECSLGESQKQKETSIRGSVGEDSHNEIPCFVVVGGFEDQSFVPRITAKARFFHHQGIHETCFSGEFEQCIFQ